MVKKLIKYDFRSYLRLLLPVQLILIGIAAINRFIQFFEPSNNDVAKNVIGYYYAGYAGPFGVYQTIFISSIVLYVISIAVALLMTLIVSIVRFYQGMYTNEGYLNHTLPVTPTQHIFAKLLTSLLFTFGSLFAVFLSLMLITAGDMNIEIFKAFFFILHRVFAANGIHAALYILEGVLFVICWCCFVYFKLYCCISIGQLVQKKKVLLAFGVFFGIYIVKQIIGTIFIITVTLNFELMAQIGSWIADHGIAATHIILCFGIVIDALFALIYFLITKHIMSKRLNLS